MLRGLAIAMVWKSECSRMLHKNWDWDTSTVIETRDRVDPCHAEYYYYLLHSSPTFYPVNLQHSSCKGVVLIRVENSVDTDQMASSIAS